MTTILSSRLNYYEEDAQGNKRPTKLDDLCEIKSNIEKFANNKNRLVWVSNNPDNFEGNDFRSALMFESFDMTWGGEFFKEKILLDHRNSVNAKAILKEADVIILCGGKCLCQKLFFDEIKMKDLLKNTKGVVVGISAGTMNLCETIYNFPEESSDLNEPRWFEGLGFCDDIIIPHFDGETASYQLNFDGMLDVTNDYVLPASHERDFIGLPNGSYIIVDDQGKKSYYGSAYKISKGGVSKIKS